jgi:hypothetical protein
MAMLRQLGFGFWAITAITVALIYTMGFAFVDDIDPFHTQDKDSKPVKI